MRRRRLPVTGSEVHDSDKDSSDDQTHECGAGGANKPFNPGCCKRERMPGKLRHLVHEMGHSFEPELFNSVEENAPSYPDHGDHAEVRQSRKKDWHGAHEQSS